MDDVPTIETNEEVMFFDTDCGGVVHNIAYLRFIETARTRLAATLGLSLRDMAATQLFPVLTRTEIDYRRSAILGDHLKVRGHLDHFDRVRFCCAFDVYRPEDDQVLVQSRQTLALVQMPHAKPTRLPSEWLKRFPQCFKA